MPNQPIKLAVLFVLIHFGIFTSGQIVIVQKGIKLPADSVIKQQLITSLNGFLAEKGKPNNLNPFVLPIDLPETSNLLDEMNGIEKSDRDTAFFKPYLSNVVRLDSNNYLIQFSYIGIKDSAPVLEASFKLLAKRKNERFYFSSPLKQNTVAWKSIKYKNLICFYKDTLDPEKAKAYQNKVYFYEDKLKAPHPDIEFYYCDNLTEALQLTGIAYKRDYNSLRSDCLTSNQNRAILIMNAWTANGFDPHDLWHDRLRTVMKSDIINRPVDEGCAYLYGGSWGYSWPEVLKRFNKYAADHPNADWLNLYINGENFVDGERIMKISYALNALMVQKIENEKGFSPVMELLGCGKHEKGDENYFKALEKITGINKINFTNKMRELITYQNNLKRN